MNSDDDIINYIKSNPDLIIDNSTILINAVKKGWFNYAKILLETNRSLPCYTDNRGYTALMYAIENRDVRMINLLINYSNNCLNTINKKGFTTKDLAIERNLINIINLIPDNEFKSNDPYNLTPIEKIILSDYSHGYDGCINKFLRYDINEKVKSRIESDKKEEKEEEEEEERKEEKEEMMELYTDYFNSGEFLDEEYLNLADTKIEAMDVIKDAIICIDNIFKKVPKNNEEIIVYRGTSSVPYLGLYKSYTSTSLSLEAALKFENGILFKIIVPNNIPCINMKEYSHFPEEDEILLPRNIFMNYISDEKTSDGTLILNVKVSYNYNS